MLISIVHTNTELQCIFGAFFYDVFCNNDACMHGAAAAVFVLIIAPYMYVRTAILPAPLLMAILRFQEAKAACSNLLHPYRAAGAKQACMQAPSGYNRAIMCNIAGYNHKK